MLTAKLTKSLLKGFTDHFDVAFFKLSTSVVYKIYTQRRLTQLLYLFMLWQPVWFYPTIFRPLFFILKAHTIGKKSRRYH